MAMNMYGHKYMEKLFMALSLKIYGKPAIYRTLFLVGAFSLKEKSPTLTVSRFFFQLTISL